LIMAKYKKVNKWKSYLRNMKHLLIGCYFKGE
jgi:hypothetical protein